MELPPNFFYAYGPGVLSWPAGSRANFVKSDTLFDTYLSITGHLWWTNSVF